MKVPVIAQRLNQLNRDNGRPFKGKFRTKKIGNIDVIRVPGGKIASEYHALKFMLEWLEKLD